MHRYTLNSVWFHARMEHDIHDFNTETQAIEKHRMGQKNIIMTFIDLEKSYDRIPRDEVIELLNGI